MAKNEFVTDRNITVRSVHGVTVKFRKGEPAYVPPQAHNDVIAVGAHMVGEELGLPDVEEVVLAPKAPMGAERESAIKDVMRSMALRNERGDFTSAGKPDIRRVSGVLKYRVDGLERDRLWDEVYHEKDDAE